jgi:hypothetical protein
VSLTSLVNSPPDIRWQLFLLGDVRRHIAEKDWAFP